MYYNKRKLAVSILWVVLGGTLLVLGLTKVIDNSIYSGMGGGLLGVGIMQIIRNIKYRTDKEYKEKIDIACKDERNGYIRMLAWAYAGWIFIVGASLVSITLFVTNRTVYGQIVSYCMCAVLALYWISYMFLCKKY